MSEAPRRDVLIAMSLAAAFAEARPAEAGAAIDLSQRIAGIPADVLTTNNFCARLGRVRQIPHP